MDSRIKQTSVFIISLRNISRKWDNLARIFQYSRLYSVPKRGAEKAIIYSAESFLVKGMRIIEDCALGNSRLVKSGLDLYKRTKAGSVRSVGTSVSAGFIGELNNQLAASSLKAAGIIIITAFTVNTLFALVFHADIVLSGWVLRSIILFIAIICLFFHADWLTLKNNSLFLKTITDTHNAEDKDTKDNHPA